jgi:hypothetical protein
MVISVGSQLAGCKDVLKNRKIKAGKDCFGEGRLPGNETCSLLYSPMQKAPKQLFCFFDLEIPNFLLKQRS